MKKELLIIIGIFLFLAIGMHFKQWTTIPFEHLMALPTATSNGLGLNHPTLGWEHPIVYTLVVYFIVGLPRLLFRKKKNNSFKI